MTEGHKNNRETQYFINSGRGVVGWIGYTAIKQNFAFL